MENKRFDGPFEVHMSVFAPHKSDMEPGNLYFFTCDLEKMTYQDAQGVHFVCPCGCGNMIYIPVVYSQQNEHDWGYAIYVDGTASITPSILELQGCKAHFYITNSMVRWC